MENIGEKVENFTTTEIELPIRVWDDKTLFMIVESATGEINGEKFCYGPNPSGGEPILLYRGRYATIPIRDIVGNMAEQIDKKLEEEKV